MMAFFNRQRQTKTAVHSSMAARAQRIGGQQAALRAMAAVQMGAQGILWITFFAYDRAQQTVWQAALAQAVPLAAVWLIWRQGARAAESRAGRYASLALLPCLMLDAALALMAFGGLIVQLIPQYPGWIGTAVPAAACLLTVLCARVRGVSTGMQLLKGWLVLLFIFGTVFLRASTRSDRLWPILGEGMLHTAAAALHGSGSLWAAALLFALPASRGKNSASLWAAAPWGLMVVWALWYGFVRPWAAGDDIAIAEKMMGLARHASSVVLYEMAGLMWMFLLPLSLMGGMASAEVLVCRAFPRCPRLMALLAVTAPAVWLLLQRPADTLRVLETLLPWRAAVSLGTGAALALIGRKEKAA